MPDQRFVLILIVFDRSVVVNRQRGLLCQNKLVDFIMAVVFHVKQLLVKGGEPWHRAIRA